MFCLGRVNHIPVSMESVVLIVLKIQYILYMYCFVEKNSVLICTDYYYLLLINDSGSLLAARHH